MNKNFSELSLGASIYIIIAVIAIGIGVYGAFRTVANYFIFEKYPVSGGGMSMMMGGGYYQTEADCLYTRTYYDEKGVGSRTPTQVELAAETSEKDRCLNQVMESRKMSQVNDIGGSVLSMIIGFGLLYVRKTVFKD